MPAMVTCSVGSRAEKGPTKLAAKSSKKLAGRSSKKLAAKSSKKLVGRSSKNLAGRSSQEMQECDALPLPLSAAPPSDAPSFLLLIA